MKADSYSETWYTLKDLEWWEIWDIYSGLEYMRKQSSGTNRTRIENILDEILRITDSESKMYIKE